MAKNNKSNREKSEKDLLDDIKRLLILQLTKGKATQEEIGKALGVRNTQINNLLMGAGKNNKVR
jgi:DNA-binding transcriptional regulator LsrR (DeoR family)